MIIRVVCDDGHPLCVITESTPVLIDNNVSGRRQTENLSPSVGTGPYIFRCPRCGRAPAVRPGRWDALCVRSRAAGLNTLKLADLPDLLKRRP